MYEVTKSDPGDYAKEFVSNLNNADEEVTDLPLMNTGWRVDVIAQDPSRFNPSVWQTSPTSGASSGKLTGVTPSS